MSGTPFGALAGLRVIDLTRVLAGPYCTQILADHGAEVVKIEPPQGDETRSWGPPFKEGFSAYFSGANRNKRSLALDLGRPEGREVLLRLLEGADALIHNFKPGGMEKWGLGYEDLKERFPKLVYCHISGFGADGPLGGFPGYDAAVQAMTGLMSVNGAPGGGPMRLGSPMTDLGTGLYAAIAILMALIERQRSGLGQKLETTLYDCALTLAHPQAANTLMSGITPVSTGNGHPNIVPYDLFPTRTRPLYLAIGNNGQFAKFCAMVGLEETAKDPRFASNAERIRNRAALTEILRAHLKDFDAEELEPRLLAEGVPAGVARNLDEALEHPHTAHRGMLAEREGYRGVATPVKLSRTPSETRRRPPLLGEQAREILAEAGYSIKEVEGLLSAGVVREG